MKVCSRVAVFVFCAVVLSVISTPLVALAEWPDKQPVTVVIQYKAGGGSDIMARAITSQMEAPLGTVINAVNRPGAVGALANDFVWQKPSDGYWWLASGNFTKSVRVLGYSKLSPWKDLQYYKAANSIQSFVVKSDSPFKTMKDFIDAARKNPGKYTISNSGVGGLWAEGIAILQREAKIDIKQIPYAGGAPATLACLQGEVDAGGGGLHETIEFIRSGKLRVLAIFAKKPITLKNGTVLEPIGKYVPSMEAYAPFGGYYCIGVKRDTPVPILEKIADAFVKACNSPSFEAVLEKKIFFKDVLIGEEADKAAARAESVTSWLMWDLKVEGVKVNPADLGIPRPEDFDKWWPPKGYKPRIQAR